MGCHAGGTRDVANGTSGSPLYTCRTCGTTCSGLLAVNVTKGTLRDFRSGLLSNLVHTIVLRAGNRTVRVICSGVGGRNVRCFTFTSVGSPSCFCFGPSCRSFRTVGDNSLPRFLVFGCEGRGTNELCCGDETRHDFGVHFTEGVTNVLPTGDDLCSGKGGLLRFGWGVTLPNSTQRSIRVGSFT